MNNRMSLKSAMCSILTSINHNNNETVTGKTGSAFINLLHGILYHCRENWHIALRHKRAAALTLQETHRFVTVTLFHQNIFFQLWKAIDSFPSSSLRKSSIWRFIKMCAQKSDSAFFNDKTYIHDSLAVVIWILIKQSATILGDTVCSFLSLLAQ